MKSVNEVVAECIANKLITYANLFDIMREAMRIYAEEYSKECLKIASEQAKTELYIPEDGGCPDYVGAFDIVDKESIQNIKLPEHK